MAGVGDKAFGGKLLSKSMTGRIVLSHVHVSTLRRTRSTHHMTIQGPWFLDMLGYIGVKGMI